MKNKIDKNEESQSCPDWLSLYMLIALSNL